MKTITVQTWSGKDTQINREDFIKRWLDNAEIWNLADYRDLDYTNQLKDEIQEKIKFLAGYKFDLKYKDEQKKEVA
jgi:hypothetical protein